MLIVNRIGNNRNHREGTCESLRCTVFCWFEWVDFYGVCVGFRADLCVRPIAFTLKKDLDVLEKHQGLFPKHNSLFLKDGRVFRKHFSAFLCCFSFATLFSAKALPGISQ